MQIRIVPQNSMHVATGKAPKIKSQSVQVSGNAFGASCKVTISKEGRRLSEQSKAQTQTAKSAQSLKTEKKMMRQLEQSEQAAQSNQSSSELQNKYMEMLDDIKRIVRSVNNNNRSSEDAQTIAKREQLLREIRDQKQAQEEENQKQAKYAQEMATQSFKAQDEVDQNNRDLFIMLKSIEESEKAEEEAENGGKAEEGSSGGQTENSVGDAIQNSAAQFTASSVKRELGVVSTIQTLNAEGHDYIDLANAIRGNAYDEISNIRTLWKDENYTDAEKVDAFFHLGAKLIGGYKNPISNTPDPDSLKELKVLADDDATKEEKEEALAAYRTKMIKDGDLGKYRNRGVQMIKDSQEGKLLHISNNPLQGMEETKNSMMQSAVDGVFNSAAQGKVDEASQELEDAVKELIDERNDITHVDEAEKEEEENKEVGELLGTETDEKEEEQMQEMGIII